jgi:hypothetical protein
LRKDSKRLAADFSVGSRAAKAASPFSALGIASFFTAFYIPNASKFSSCFKIQRI